MQIYETTSTTVTSSNYYHDYYYCCYEYYQRCYCCIIVAETHIMYVNMACIGFAMGGEGDFKTVAGLYLETCTSM